MRIKNLNTNAASSPSRASPQSVGRIFLIMESLTELPAGATLSELATKTDAPKTSLVGLLTGLTNEGYLLRDQSGRYFLGPQFLSLAMKAVAGRELVTLVRPTLEKLSLDTGETAVLGALASDAELVTYLDRAESINPIRYAVSVGERRDLYCTAMGKLLLAFFDEPRLDKYLKKRRRAFTPSTVTKAEDLKNELSYIRSQGLSYTQDERIDGASGIAAPIYSSEGEVIASLLIAGPSGRMAKNAYLIEPLLEQAAKNCSLLIGGKSKKE
ncbi:MAG: IclR family transcriptional regulator [Sneathiella sp.]